MKNVIDKLNESSPLDDFKPADELFYAHLPDSLYMTHYDLHAQFPHISKDEWRRFLRDHDRFIIKETALIAEANARSALQRLASGTLKQGDSTAISQLLKQSEQINQQAKDKTQYVTMFMPDPNSRELKSYNHAETFKKNRDIVHKFFRPEFLQQRVQRGEVFLNADGTVHILNPNTYSAALDNAYLALFNPTNQKITELDEEKGRDWQ